MSVFIVELRSRSQFVAELGFIFSDWKAEALPICSAVTVAPFLYYVFFTSKKNKSVLRFLTVSCVVGINGLGWFGSR